MKKLKYAILFICVLILTSCDLNDDFSDKYLYTTGYPVEFATTMLYSDYAKIESIYPNGAEKNFNITEKKKTQYSSGEIFIYSGVYNEAELTKDLLNKNHDLRIIDATKGMSILYDIEEVWLDPSNYLMLCSNIKNSLIEYNDNVYIKENIEDNYKLLNEKISELDVILYDIGKNGNYNSLLVTNDLFKYLEKYNIDVISIDKDIDAIDKAYASAKKKVDSKEIQYVYSLDDEVLTEAQEKFITENNLIKVNINNLFTLSDDERNSNETYITLAKKIIDEYKKELYKK